MMLGKLPVPGRPSNLADGRARAYCACIGCGWGLFVHFYCHLSFSPLSPSLLETAKYRLKYCLKGPLNPKQPTNNRHVWWCGAQRYSRTSVARTPMARLPRLFRTRSRVPRKYIP